MRSPIIAGSTDQSIDIFIPVSTSGDGLTGLAFDTSGLTCYYRIGPTGTPTQLPLVTLANAQAAHADGGFVEIDATNMKGGYRLDLSDAMVSSAGILKIWIQGAAGMYPVPIEQPVGFNVQNTDKAGYSISGTIQTLDVLNTAQDVGHAQTQADIDALNDISPAEVNAECDTAIADASLATEANITALNNLSQAEAQTAAETAIDGKFNLSAGVVDADLKKVNGQTQEADSIQKSLAVIAKGTAIAGSLSTTEMTTDLSLSADGQLNGRTLIFTSNTTTAALRKQATSITSSLIVNGKLTFPALTNAPQAGDTWIIV